MISSCKRTFWLEMLERSMRAKIDKDVPAAKILPMGFTISTRFRFGIHWYYTPLLFFEFFFGGFATLLAVTQNSILLSTSERPVMESAESS
mmetsp:Transcript_65510/g.106218  ORF Transcript_65510/g.106218 Transcript_65510/m.106218 type:complete len:91 (+) Transcript_65510:163-435(+)